MNHEFKFYTNKSDEYYTPLYAVQPILEFIPKNKIIWCPFDTSESNFVRALRQHGCKVVNGHISKGKDFFQYSPKEFDYIISNPPYSLRTQVLTRLFSFKKPFAMLVNVGGLFDSKKRFDLFSGNRFELLIFDKRVGYFKNGVLSQSSPFQSVYICNNLLPKQIVFKNLIKQQ